MKLRARGKQAPGAGACGRGRGRGGRGRGARAQLYTAEQWAEWEEWDRIEDEWVRTPHFETMPSAKESEPIKKSKPGRKKATEAAEEENNEPIEEVQARAKEEGHGGCRGRGGEQRADREVQARAKEEGHGGGRGGGEQPADREVQVQARAKEEGHGGGRGGEQGADREIQAQQKEEGHGGRASCQETSCSGRERRESILRW